MCVEPKNDDVYGTGLRKITVFAVRPPLSKENNSSCRCRTVLFAKHFYYTPRVVEEN